MSPLSAESIKLKLDHIIRDVFHMDSSIKVEGLSANTNSAWDSLRHVELCLRIQNEFTVKFDGSEIVRMKSYDEIVKVLRQHLDSRLSGN